jgi:hypothetical protein
MPVNPKKCHTPNSAQGKFLQKHTSMNKNRLSSLSEPVFKDGKVYWITVNGKKGTINELVLPAIR